MGFGLVLAMAVPVAVGIASSVRATVLDAVLAIGQLRLAAGYLLLHLPAPVGGIQAPCHGSPRDSDGRRGYSNAGEQLDRKRSAGSSEKRPRGLAARGRAAVGDRHGRERVQDPVQ